MCDVLPGRIARPGITHRATSARFLFLLYASRTLPTIALYASAFDAVRIGFYPRFLQHRLRSTFPRLHALRGGDTERAKPGVKRGSMIHLSRCLSMQYTLT